MNGPTCPTIPDVHFGRKLIEYFGGNSSLIKDNWCWADFTEAFPELKEKIEKYFEKAKAAYAAYCMVKYCGSDRKWAENIIENTKICNSAHAAYCMVEFCGSNREWAEKIIENA